MAPTPEMCAASSLPGDQQPASAKVVISGMSGLYPRARYVKDLEHILYGKINPVTSEDLRWKYNHPEAAQYTGSVPELSRFDAQFFKVHYRLATVMDAMSKKILEMAYEAIYDAGVSPEQLSGKKVGVFIGTCFSETEKASFYLASSRTGFGIAGCNKSMFANRISYWLNVKGPSLSIDVACCSSTAAVEQAYLAMARGECEAALVGGANLCLHPQSSVHYGRIMTLSQDGKTKSFHQDAAGCAKSEAINVLFLQKPANALRVYADLLYVKTEFRKLLDGETGPKYGFFRDPLDSAKFLNEFYKEAGVPPRAVDYVEAFGCAMPEADKAELEALDKVFCNGGREAPLLVGSVMSNIGYGEAACGISAITKVLLGFHRGELAGNLHCESPRSDVAALREGRIQVLQDHKPFRGPYAAVNSMSVTGVNGHVLLHATYKPKDLNRYKSSIAQLVTISGRQDSSVERVIDNLKTRTIDPEELVLLRNIHKTRIAGHLGRGYVILDTNKENDTISLSEKSDYFDGVSRPLWFVYSGMGSQWAGMGAQLMRIPVFAAAIERCRLALEPYGLDIVNIITSPDKTMFDNILHSFVGIAAVQIGLTDVLRELGISPDNIIGHSVGELACAYADGCLTAEEMILSAYSRGRVSLETDFIRGSMAAVGVGYQEISKMCPPEIEVACHNGPESSTISGPAEAMTRFVAALTAKGIFAKEVPCSNIAYHSRYITEAGPGLLKYLKQVIKSPKPRTQRWVSTSVPQEHWDKPNAKLSSAEYHTNNLLSPVLFEETIKLIPSDAVLIEIAPHGLLQAILKRSLPESCVNIPLTRRGHADNTRMVLDAVGKLYMEGFNPDVQALYPKINFPVSTGTPMLSHLVDWAHGQFWGLPLYQTAHRTVAASCKYIISVYDEEYSYFRGHVLQDKNLLPVSFVLVAVWDTLAMTLKVPKKQLSVEFRDVVLFAEPVLREQRALRLSVALHRGSGRFEVMHENGKIAAGFINSDVKVKDNIIEDPQLTATESKNYFNSQELYQLLYQRGYDYRSDFCVIKGANELLTEANLVWNENWVTFIDGLIQFHTLRNPNQGVSRVSHIRHLAINVGQHKKFMKEEQDQVVIKAKVDDNYDLISCGGVTVEEIILNSVPYTIDDNVDLKSLNFVPRFDTKTETSSTLNIFLQIVAENLTKDKLKVVGLTSGKEDSATFVEIKNIAKNKIVAGIEIQFLSVAKYEALNVCSDYVSDIDVIIIQDLSHDDNVCQELHKILKRNCFIINEEHILEGFIRVRPSALYTVVAANNNVQDNIRLELARWRPTSSSAIASSAFTIRSESDLELLINTRNTLPPQNGLIIISSYPPVDGLTDLVKEWRREKERNAIYVVMANNGSLNIKELEELPNMDLAFNILNNGVWGGEYYVPVKETSATETGDVMLMGEQNGNMESLKWVQVPKQNGPGLSVKVHYAGVNLHDVKTATLLSSEPDKSGYGMDYSGLTESGERVMGLVPNGSARSEVIAVPELLWPVPQHWSLKEAATVPLAYTYAFYLWLKVTYFREDQEDPTILIHGGTGAIGQAMINIALGHGFKVFATVSSVQKKNFLMKLFPQIKAEYIGNSRNGSFADMVLHHTNGKGVTVVVCCVRGELKFRSLKCPGSSGVTIDNKEIKEEDNFCFGMYDLTMDRSYVTLDVRSFFTESEISKEIQYKMAEGISSGYVRPLSSMEYGAEEATRALRLLAASRHRGRVLLRLTDTRPYMTARIACSPDHSHLVVSDGEPLGLQLVDRLISRGAKKIHLNLLQPSVLPRYKIRSWKSQGVTVTVTSLNLTDEAAITDLLKTISKSGFLAGIFIVRGSVENALINNFDSATRKSCPYMKYFLVVGNNLSQKTFKNRYEDGLPATSLDISQLEKSQYQDAMWYKHGVSAVEQALCSPHPILRALPKKTPSTPLMQQIAAVANVKLPNELLNDLTLESVGIDLDKSQLVSKFLSNVHNVYLDIDEVPTLTIERLKQIEDSLAEVDLKELNGLKIFYSYAEPDELLATTGSVMLSTLTNSANMRDDEFDVNETHLCMVPGLDGLYARFHTLCERLKLPALVLQPGLDRPREDPDRLAHRYSKLLLRKTALNKKFFLVGYEFGVIVALKLAAILEKNGLHGTVFCIGDGPKEIVSLIKKQLQCYTTDDELQIALLRNTFSVIGDGDTHSLEKALVECSSWEQRMEASVRLLLGRVPHSVQYARSLMEAAYARIKMARDFTPSPERLQSQIVLIRAGNKSSLSSSLQEYSVKPIIVHDVPTPFSQITNDLRCSSIINSHLPVEVLEAFNSRNLCDSYLLNADSFMTVANEE